MKDEDVLLRLAAFHPDARTYQPFSATFHMASPVCLAHPWINGDALIASQLMRHLLGEDFYTLPTKKPLPVDAALQLPLKKSYGVYHSSVSIFDTDAKYLNTIYKRFDDKHVDIVDTKKKKIVRGAGFFKDCMVRAPYIPARDIVFYMNGDIDLCRMLLKNVSHLGKDRARGFGEIESVDVEPIEVDISLFDESKCMRPIPCRSIKHLGFPEQSMMLAYKIPYWARKDADMCVVPGSVIWRTGHDA